MAGYVSEFTQFMNAWLQEHPEAIQARETGIALWWDKPQDEVTRERQQAAKVPVKPYYYDVNQ